MRVNPAPIRISPLETVVATRGVSGYDMFVRNANPDRPAHAPRPPTVIKTLPCGRKISDIAAWNKSCSAAWNALDEETKEKFSLQAEKEAKRKKTPTVDTAERRRQYVLHILAVTTC